jgi:hypothetical protein
MQNSNLDLVSARGRNFLNRIQMAQKYQLKGGLSAPEPTNILVETENRGGAPERHHQTDVKLRKWTSLTDPSLRHRATCPRYPSTSTLAAPLQAKRHGQSISGSMAM